MFARRLALTFSNNKFMTINFNRMIKPNMVQRNMSIHLFLEGIPETNNDKLYKNEIQEGTEDFREFCENAEVMGQEEWPGFKHVRNFLISILSEVYLLFCLEGASLSNIEKNYEESESERQTRQQKRRSCCCFGSLQE